MGCSVGVAGASGYAGAEVLRLLQQHPALRVSVAAAAHEASLRSAAPWLDLDMPVAAATVEAFDGCDVVFLATPASVSGAFAPALCDAGTRVVDLSGAFRLTPHAFAAAYALDPPTPERMPAPYGLPELFRDEVAGADLVANPGCYPTAALLALAPLRDVVQPETVVVTGISGTSGAGKALSDPLHVSHALHEVRPYGGPHHRHRPEMTRIWQRLAGPLASVTFVPHVVPTTRGLVCTVAASLRDDLDDDALHALLQGSYAAERFVRVLAPGCWPGTATLRGSNLAVVGGVVDRDTGRVTVACAIDNLVKGAAGQAVQNANVMLGLPEDAGLPTQGIYP